MSEELKTVFGLIGIVATCGVLGGFLAAIIFWIKERIKDIRHFHNVKHRFDKPPTAKCYCTDCKMHSENGRCGKFDGWSTADNWFCWDATPREKGAEK